MLRTILLVTSFMILVTSTAESQETVLSGQFNRLDRSHWAEGRVTVVESGDGVLSLRFADNFRAPNGPDLRVVLSSSSDPGSGEALQQILELDFLTQNSGPQIYEIPADLEVETVRSVVIYCRRFDVLFSVARLSPPRS